MKHGPIALIDAEMPTIAIATPDHTYEKTASNIEDFVKKKDKKRAAFYNYFSQNKWGDARHYHLAISSVYGVDFAVEVLKHAAESFPGGEAL